MTNITSIPLKHAQPTGVVILTIVEVLTGFFALAATFYLVTLSYVDLSDLILVSASVLVSFPLAYGLWGGRNWAWAGTLILSMIGIVVVWPNFFMLLPDSWGSIKIAAYLGYFVAIIFYLMRPHVKAFFNVQAVGESSLKVAQVRLLFIDFARGIVMILMAWDHVNHFWTHRQGSEGLMGWRPVFSSFTQFLLRFITHYCAPTFIFLAGTALALSTARRLTRGESQMDIDLRIIKRGAVLLFLEAFVVSPAFDSPALYFGVIACIGVCFIIFTLLRRMPFYAILALSVFIILAHPFLSLNWIPYIIGAELRWYLRVIIHEPSWNWLPYVGLYPIIPWLGVMGLGWCFGIFLTSYDRTQIKRLTLPIVAAGGVSMALWFLVRILNGYGNLLPRTRMGNTLQDWLYVAKYPPSLAFLLWTLGGMCFFLALGLHLQNRPGFARGVTGAILTFGKIPLFFYCIHLWLYRLWVGWWPRPSSFEMGLVGTAVFWLVGLVILWRLCIWYELLKRSYPDSLLQYI